MEKPSATVAAVPERILARFVGSFREAWTGPLRGVVITFEADLGSGFHGGTRKGWMTHWLLTDPDGTVRCSPRSIHTTRLSARREGETMIGAKIG
jgi:hypothetical protein